MARFRPFLKIWPFGFFLLLILVVDPAYGENQSCEIGQKIRLFDKHEWKTKSAASEKLLVSVINEPVFSFDDEKYLRALLLLLQYPDSKGHALEKISNYLNRPLSASLSAASRERKANALFQLTESNDESISHFRSQVERLLSVEFPETLAAKKIKVPALSQADWLRRIEILSTRNENALVISEITQKEPSWEFSDSYSCRVGFLFGKALRNSKRYQEARDKLSEVAKKCESNEGRDAAFILARLAAISPSNESLRVFAEFQKKYPKHSYLDDVLLFKASALDSLGRREDAKRALGEISELESPADMKLEAEFRLAFLNASEGNTDEALRVLKSAIDAKSELPFPLIQKQRIKYWYARLQLFPELLSYKKAANFETLDAPKKILQELATSSPSTFYSWLSAELLKDMSLPINAPKLKRAIVKATEISDPFFKACFCMAIRGYRHEAERLIELSEPSLVNQEERLAIARKLNEIGLVADAFRYAQAAGGADAELGDDLDLLTLFYPKAHSREVEVAAKKIGIQTNLLYGLMREESRFDPRAISWAGARGLFQLMPQVAREEGIKFKMKNLSDEAILDPKINVLLGAEHLKGMIEKLDHPLFGVAAYNAGLKSANDWQEKFRTFKAIDAFVENIPFPETRGYVKRVASSWVNYARIYSNKDDLFALDIKAQSGSKHIR